MSFFSFSREIYRRIPVSPKFRLLLRDLFLRLFFPHRLAEIRREMNLPYRGDPLSPSLRDNARLSYRAKAEVALDTFLASDRTLSLPGSPSSELTVVIVIYNEPGLSFRCFESLALQDAGNFEVIIVDNASNERTQRLLSRVHGPRVIRHRNNMHYIAGVNSALPHINSQFTLLLNNDVILDPGVLKRLLQIMKADASIGAASPQIVSIDRLLLECGCEITGDGRGVPLKRGEPPETGHSDPHGSLVEVDYVSGCFLLTPTAQLKQRGGLDTRYSPAYYDDSDYCSALWLNGKRVVIDLSTQVIHFESAASTPDEVARLVERNRHKFVEKFRWNTAHQARTAGGDVKTRHKAHPS